MCNLSVWHLGKLIKSDFTIDESDPTGQLMILCKFDEIVDGEDLLIEFIEDSAVNFSRTVPYILSNVFLNEEYLNLGSRRVPMNAAADDSRLLRNRSEGSPSMSSYMKVEQGKGGRRWILRLMEMR
jgi:hypothetical protein